MRAVYPFVDAQYSQTLTYVLFGFHSNNYTGASDVFILRSFRNPDNYF